MIIGTWNLEVYPSRLSVRGIAMAEATDRHPTDVWLLTELHSDWEVEGHAICFSPSRAGTLESRRFAGIATTRIMEPISALDDPVEGWMCLARLTDPDTKRTCLTVATVLPWRGSTPYWRNQIDPGISYSEAFRHVLDYVVLRIEAERKPGEDVIWGGDFNQGLSGRDYVGTHRGRSDLTRALDQLGLQATTSYSPALIPTHPAIDHIALPSGWNVACSPRVHRPTACGKPLSDHALYLVEAGPNA